jgi:O-antigen/teichoic acid export membrane protein
VNELLEAPDSSAASSAGARRVARNAAVRSVGEIIGKVATVAIFVAIARKLGPVGFGDITFALALTGQLLPIFTFGVDTVLAREVARKPGLLGSFMGNVVVLKLAVAGPALLVAGAVVQFGNYSHDARLATYLIGISVTIDTLENTWGAAFQAHERLEFVSAVIVFQRIVTGGLVLAVLANGAGVIQVSGMLVVGSVAALLFAMWLLRFVASPAWSFQRSRLAPLLRAGIPIGFVLLLLTVLLRLDTVLISLIAGNHEVGIYGAAFRLLESTMFLSWSFGSAIFPWLSRKHVENQTQLARGYELGLVVMLALLTPISLGFILLAKPIIHLLYGTSYDGAITPLRLLGVVVISYGINSLTNLTLTAHDRPGLMNRIVVVAVIQNVGMNLVLIPPYGATGAALTAAVSGVLLGTLSIWQVARALGHIRLTRIFIGPAVGAGAMSLAVVLVWNSLVWGLLLGGAAYFAGLLLVERMFFPDDLARLLASARIRPKNA